MNVSHRLSENQYLVTYNVGSGESGSRIDNFLKSRYHRRSREQIKRALDSGAISIIRTSSQVGKIKPSSTVMLGDQVHVMTERKEEPEVNFNYKILFEDETLFIVEKPSNLPVHPAGKYFFNTLTTHLKTQGFKTPLNDDVDFYLAHRIDKETSGVLVLSKDKEVSQKLAAQFADRTTEKTYLAITHGRIEKDEFSVDVPIGRDPNAPVTLKMAPLALEAGGQTAATKFKVIERRGNFTLVECYPKTGRQHQIRVHLDHVGHPIVGDKLYGIEVDTALTLFERRMPSASQNTLTSMQFQTAMEISPEVMEKLILPRHALHAAGIKFSHPITGKRVEFRSGLPEDLQAFFDTITI
ncbi:MAG: RluA family pseudouridine synthase [Xanthomonadaceae bacterium]|nr:RluA family pseudouridine synthase [Xanthomonadaceae bacterium]